MRVLYLSAFVIVIDQLTKLFVKGFSIPFLGIKVDGMNYGQSIKVIDDIFKITFVENPGMAFGIGVNTYVKLFLSLFSLVAAVVLIFYLYKNRQRSLTYRVSIALIIAGAFGNFIDRAFYGLFYGYAPIFYGKVVDFFNFDFFDFTIFGRTYERFPIFNVADSAVTVGVIILIFYFNWKHDEETKKLEAESASEDGVLTNVEVENEIVSENKAESDEQDYRLEENKD